MSSAAARSDGASKPKTPDRLAIDRVAAEVVEQYGQQIMLDAVRYSANRQDAEDAYQRALIVLLTKAPSDDPDQVVPWLRVVVRNEALEISRTRARREIDISPESLAAFESDQRSPETVTEELARVEMGFEALKRLNQDQTQCLLAQAEGLDYEEIAALTGFTRRKVSRCLERGREAFARRFEAIAVGSECERMQPLLHRLLEADQEAAREVRPHLRHCIACRARLRAYESAPRDVAAMLPPAIIVISAKPLGMFERLADLWNATVDRISAHATGLDRWAEIGTAKKIAAVAAVAGAAASGGAAIHHVTDSKGPSASMTTRSAVVPRGDLELFDRIDVPAVRRPHPKRRVKPVTRSASQPHPTSAQYPTTNPAPSTTNNSVDDGSSEFAPEARSAE